MALEHCGGGGIGSICGSILDRERPHRHDPRRLRHGRVERLHMGLASRRRQCPVTRDELACAEPERVDCRAAERQRSLCWVSLVGRPCRRVRAIKTLVERTKLGAAEIVHGLERKRDGRRARH
eukprot:Amastigsp_a849259_132.p2 type:complete len:123 gc:universal Amastigsp_a849259_132:417-785(+)